jgi:two-component system, chemotaxis family, chemotaxis protein CheY
VAVILSADDDPDIRHLIERVLTAAGHQVILVSDGQAALDAAYANSLDLVILDVEMPGVHGLAACRTLRDDPRTSHLPVIIASGSLVPPYEEVGAAGATACVTKPFSPVRLREVVEKMLAAVAPA